MKRIMLMLAAALCLSACGGDNKENTTPEIPQDPGLAGTKWVRSVSSTTNHVIEFVDDTNCRDYEMKNGALSGSVYDGKYSYADNAVTFDSDKGVVWVSSTSIVTYYRHTFRTADISGNIMKVTATTEYIVMNIGTQTTTITDEGTTTFTYMKNE